MTTQLSIHHEFAASQARVRTLLHDARCAETVARTAGALDASASVEGDEMRITRASEVPDIARALVRDGQLIVTETRIWNGNVASIALTFTGLPVQASGSLELQEQDGRCTLQLDLAISAQMPFMSGMIESLARERLIEAMVAEFAALEAAVEA